jgi:hypothetical protein
MGEVSFVSLLTPRTPDSIVAADHNLRTGSPEVRSTGLDSVSMVATVLTAFSAGSKSEKTVPARDSCTRIFCLVGTHAGATPIEDTGCGRKCRLSARLPYELQSQMFALC